MSSHSSQKEACRYFDKKGVIGGMANKHPLTPELALKVGQAAGLHLRQGTYRHRAVVAKEPRLSGYMLETAITAGLTSAGVDVLLTGPIPTPAVALLTVSMRCDIGIMLSAADMPYEYNGIRLFGPNGRALSGGMQRAVGELIDADVRKQLAVQQNIGRAKRIEGAQDRYIEHAKRALPQAVSFDGLRVVADCAHGAAYQVAPRAFAELGAEVIAAGVEPNGLNIHQGCGPTAPHALQRRVREVRADFGLALNGDGSRVLLCDEKQGLLESERLQKFFAAEEWRDDGVITALRVLALLKQEGKPASELFKRFG